MTSVICFVGIIYIIFSGLFLIKKRRGLPLYEKPELFMFYVITRIVPTFMFKDQSLKLWINLLLELALIGLFLYYLNKKTSKEKAGCIFALYLFQPASILSVLSAKVSGLLVLLVTLEIICICYEFIIGKKGNIISFLPEYFILGIGALSFSIATGVIGQHLRDIGKVEGIPVALIMAVAILMVVLIRCIYRMVAGNYIENPEAVCGNTNKDCSCRALKNKTLTRNDIVIMLVLTVVFGGFVLYGLGSHKAPETYKTLKQGGKGSNQVVLNFDREVKLSKIYIYLGYKSDRVFSFSYKSNDVTEWKVFESKHEVESPFKWNEVKVDNALTSLGMVLMDGEASIHEIVCIDEGGNRVLPSNAGDNINLFDEQSLFKGIRTYYDQTMFDEVYHGRTAYEFLHGLSIYENTHPPLGKTIISIGIRFFGMNPFGWRIMCGLFGILMVPLMYLFAHRMLRSTGTAAFTTILLCTGFMNLTLSRIATIDILVALFVLLMFYFMYLFCVKCDTEKNFKVQALTLGLCGISMALAISTKWTGFYGVLGIAVIFFIWLWRNIGGFKGIKKNRSYLVRLAVVCCISFILIPFLIYTLSYIPFMKVYKDKGLLKAMIDNGKLMLSYHSTTVFEHPYSSEWYEWLFDIKPLLDSYTTLKDGNISTIATFCNPLLAWGGLAALFHQFYLWRCEKCRNAQFLILAYCSMVMPWLFIHRTVFIYQYFIGFLIIILMIGNSMIHLKKGKKYMIITASISIALFILFYPVLTGIGVKYNFVNMVLEWMMTWRFAI